MSTQDAIESLSFFQTLDAKQIQKLVSISKVSTYNQEYILHYENQDNENLLFLVDGLLKAYKIDKHSNEIFLYYIYKDSLISEVQDLKADKLNSFSNIQLLEDSTILSVNFTEFKKLFLQNFILCSEFTQEIISRSNELHSLINREFIFDSVSKVAMMLYNDVDMFNKLKRHDISLILHIQPATLSRVLNRLKRNQIIDIIRGKILILDKKALKEVYKDVVDD